MCNLNQGVEYIFACGMNNMLLGEKPLYLPNEHKMK